MKVDVSAYEGMIFDMDGVITRTAALHAEAWKRMFDGFLQKRAEDEGRPLEPFDIVDDYRAYVDGKPRLEGLQSFLAARQIELPWGDASDRVGAETVHGLGKLKNELFQGLVEERGVEVFPGSVLLAGRARVAGLRSGIVTSSKNGPLIMERSGLMGLFDVLVDGNVAAERSLKGKPEPDIMVETARRLDVDPGQTMLFEDASVGVEAGHAAGMKLVVGVARNENRRRLRDAGADVVVDDLAEVSLSTTKPSSTAGLRSALDIVDVLAAIVAHVPRVAVFLDYDGTLTPIVERPEMAKLQGATRDTLSRLADRYQVAVISGRGLDDVRSLVGLDHIFYAGSHGFEIAKGEGTRSMVDQGSEYLPVIDEVEEALHDRLGDISGVLIERKRLSVAVHFRLAAPEAEATVSDVVDTVMSRHEGLRRSGGKKVIEVQPDIDWDKGKAVDWLLRRLEVDPSQSLVIYVGDDLTDEDAFQALDGWGVGIVVRDPTPRETYADLALEDTEEVRIFLQGLVEIADRAGGPGDTGGPCE